MKRILLTAILSLALIVPCFAEQLTLEKIGEDKIILDITKEIKKQIPADTIVTSETIKTIENRIEKIVIKAGYLKKEHSIKTIFCPGRKLLGHIHYIIMINAKTQLGQYKLEGRYYFKKQAIKPII